MRVLAVAVLSTLMVSAATAQTSTPPMAPDIPAKFDTAIPNADYVKRDVMIPMRDGVKLHTVIVIPKGAVHAPMVLSRTPYNASGRAQRNVSPSVLATVGQGDEVMLENGYIRVYQDVRGKYGSEGEYVMTRPVKGPLNSTRTDHTTDAWDTIDWLVKNVPESNGNVGMIGSSYEGFTVLMALVDPHPALKVAVPMSPMVDGWRGDDWFHNGAFRVTNLSYIAGQTAAKGSGKTLATGVYDDYEGVLRGGSTADYARQFGLDQLNFVRKLFEHPAYDSYWQQQALDKILAKRPMKVPTMTVVGYWDQEDIYGAHAFYSAVEPQDKANDKNFLVVGPWRHSGVNYDGSSLGPLKFTGDTALEFRRDVMQPFLDQYLKDGAPAADTPPVLFYQTGVNRWQRLQRWPLACETGCPAPLKPIYLKPDFKLDFDAPQQGAGFDEYVSDPAKPVPFVPRPVHMNDASVWRPWLVSDQRGVSDRTDVLSYVTEPLKARLQIAGAAMVNLYASTTGTDTDWVVKLIDVYPDEVPSQPELGGYQLGIAMDIFRGRYRNSFEHPSPVAPGAVEKYRFALPNANHVFLPGHRVMVQIQSSWFPLYDRNPQTYVQNIFHAKPADYKKATLRVYHAGAESSALELPVVEGK
ncbi:CocE/NonD family hydrolase [Duganella sp. BJB488]|uniref:CocE/NonD family hydrolase n=1 Tax=unclassified Duganella TaxID=2636909 RepID=UPI000E342917|nr:MULTISPECIES: CocE/NonD family hydrolase [unclassified Duganella]NVD74138.1 CocE/NonD family hydrolase [Duganella sp. BJB1802]RFP21573.1 CocE/NonD family hydrolase [Duganella sp. BJB489]RFP23366.1 CocE/NonD family hydrolase [Duganella sp. BJB488]RFP38532.1 CocE/NonD family hydrolase [Duganella sp. BJB480]